MLSLEEWSNWIAPSGREHTLSTHIINQLSGFVDDISTNNLGNTILFKAGSGKKRKKIAMIAHLDEIAIVVKKICDNKAFFITLYRANPYDLFGKQVVFLSGQTGVVTTDNKQGNTLLIDDLYIDISGTTDLQAGEFGVFLPCYREQGDYAYGKALDDRVGCYILSQMISNRINSINDLYYIFSVQEEVGLRGAESVINSIKPDLLISIDATPAVDENIILGDGLVLKVCDGGNIIKQTSVDALINACRNNNLSFQLDVSSHGKTDSAAQSVLSSDIPTIGISFPCKYMHTSTELVCLRDIEQVFNLMCIIVQNDLCVK